MPKDNDNTDGRESAVQGPREYIFEKLGLKGGPQSFDHDLYGIWALFKADPTTTHAAFEALYRIGQHWHDDNVPAKRPDAQFGLDPLANVKVPWWVIHVIAHRWRQYIDTSGAKLGEIFGLEGGGQGKRRKADTLKTAIDHFYVACAVVMEINEFEKRGEKISVENAVGNVADRFDMVPETVSAHYKEHRERAQRGIEETSSNSVG